MDGSAERFKKNEQILRLPNNPFNRIGIGTVSVAEVREHLPFVVKRKLIAYWRIRTPFVCGLIWSYCCSLKVTSPNRQKGLQAMEVDSLILDVRGDT